MARLANFMAKLNLKKHQRALVQSFSKYRLENLERSKSKEEEHNKIVDDYDPTSSMHLINFEQPSRVDGA